MTFRGLSTVMLACILSGCGGGGGDTAAHTTAATSPTAATSAWVWSLPSYVAAPAVPADNPMSEAKFQLGRSLFYDMRLSGNGIQSCASCHIQSKAFTDGLALSRGATGEFTPRNAQPLGNSAWHTSYTWGQPNLSTLEQQMLIPLFAEHPVEMGLTPANQDAMLARLNADSAMTSMFSTAFPAEATPVTLTNVIQSIATFQRGLVTANSPYDQFLQGKATLSSSATRGKDLFFSEALRCASCHGGFNLDTPAGVAQDSSALFQNTGLYNIDGAGGYPEPNRGVFETTGAPADMGKFRVASLRNIALTAPYMHDGSIATLNEVLDHYAAGGRVLTSGPNAGDGRQNPYKNPMVSGFTLTAQGKSDLIAFLQTLTDSTFITNPRFSDPNKSE
jgi:cytochrome c peroxidase